MTENSYVSVGLVIVGFVSTWVVWCSVSLFRLNLEVSLIKQELKILVDVKHVLDLIRDKLS